MSVDKCEHRKKIYRIEPTENANNKKKKKRRKQEKKKKKKKLTKEKK